MKEETTTTTTNRRKLMTPSPGNRPSTRRSLLPRPDGTIPPRTTPLGDRLLTVQARRGDAPRRRQPAKPSRQGRSDQSSSAAVARRRTKRSTVNRRYRRVKVLRWWVLPAICLVPLGVLLVEYYVGRLIRLEDVKDTYFQRFGIDPWDVERDDIVGRVPPIADVTRFTKTRCPDGLKLMINLHNPKSHDTTTTGHNIPRILHQHGPGRCLSRTYHSSSVQWASTFRRWSFYFHDDLAVHRLFLLHDHGFPEFPLWKAVTTRCVYHSTTVGDLWTFLCLWLYGGVHVDVRYKPGRLDANFVHPRDDGVFFMEQNAITTKVMAAAPRHPVLFYAIHGLLDHILEGNVNVTGEVVLREALDVFRNTEEKDGLLAAGIYPGSGGRSVRIVRDVEKSGLVKRVAETDEEMKEEYEKMGWDFHGMNAEDGTGNGTCLGKIYYGEHVD